MNIKTCRLCQHLNDGLCMKQNKSIGLIMPYELCGFTGTWESRKSVCETKVFEQAVVVGVN